MFRENDTHVVQTSRLGLFPSLIWLDCIRWSQEVVFDVLFNQSDHASDASWCVCVCVMLMNLVLMPVSL